MHCRDLHSPKKIFALHKHRKDCSCEEKKESTFTSYAPIVFSSGVSTSLLPRDIGGEVFPAPIVSDFPQVLGFGNSSFARVGPEDSNIFPPFVITSGSDRFNSTDGTILAGGFSFPIPFAGRIKNLQVSSDILTELLPGNNSPSVLPGLNTMGLQINFRVFISHSCPNNGLGHFPSPYLFAPLGESVFFGGPLVGLISGNIGYNTALSTTNLNTSSLMVYPGDRVGILVQTSPDNNTAALEVRRASFSASLSYDVLDTPSCDKKV